jgi:hypothetical protein
MPPGFASSYRYSIPSLVTTASASAVFSLWKPIRKLLKTKPFGVRCPPGVQLGVLAMQAKVPIPSLH